MADVEPREREALECPWCCRETGEWSRLEFTRSKYVCPRCRRPVRDCCDGETATRE